MERRGSGIIVVSVRRKRSLWIYQLLQSSKPLLHCAGLLCVHFGVLLNHIGPSPVEGGRCCIEQNSCMMSGSVSDFSAV